MENLSLDVLGKSLNARKLFEMIHFSNKKVKDSALKESGVIEKV